MDANDGVQAQTVANFYLAFAKDLTIVPVINKIDLKNADPERVMKQLHSLFDIEPREVLKVGICISEHNRNIIAKLEIKVSNLSCMGFTQHLQ